MVITFKVKSRSKDVIGYPQLTTTTLSRGDGWGQSHMSQSELTREDRRRQKKTEEGRKENNSDNFILVGIVGANK